MSESVSLTLISPLTLLAIAYIYGFVYIFCQHMKEDRRLARKEDSGE